MQRQRSSRDTVSIVRPEPIRAYGTMNTLRALERLALEPLSTSELAAHLQIGVRTARRLLRRLELEGYVVQEGGQHRRFRATLRLAVVGRQLASQAQLTRLAARWVSRLATATACTAHFWVPAGDDLLCVAHAAPGDGADRPEPMLRELVPLDDGAAATVLAQPDGRLSAYVAGDGAATAAAPVLDRDAIAGAIGVSGPCGPEALDAAARAAAGLSRELEALP